MMMDRCNITPPVWMVLHYHTVRLMIEVYVTIIKNRANQIPLDMVDYMILFYIEVNYILPSSPALTTEIRTFGGGGS